MTKAVYLDNAATTPVAPEVVNTMLPFLKEHFGNPSSSHQFGRKVRASIEQVRKNIADLFHATPSEFIFTSGGTEADNMAIHCAIHDLGVERIITSPVEHHAVLHTVHEHCDQHNLKVEEVRLNEWGEVDITHLEELLKSGEKTLVSLMHANNEVGNLIDLKKIALLCKEYDTWFHSDTVQTIGHVPIDLSNIPVDFITCAAHKLHGPKGVGFLFVRKGLPFKRFIHGGSQERERRGGTENVSGIIGLGKAIEMAHDDMMGHKNHVLGLKNYMKEELLKINPDILFNGRCSDDCLYTVLSVNFPPHPQGDMLLFTLDIEGIACSGGSACSSGSNKGSHVINTLQPKNEGPNIRFSFSRYTTKDEINHALSVLKKIYSFSHQS